MEPYFIAAGTAYFLGSIPFGYILVRLFLKQDIRTTGSGNIGATNVARSGAKGLALATLILDAGKGALAVLMAEIFGARVLERYSAVDVPLSQSIANIAALAALFAVLGHVFPVWLKFKGGKGVATAVGAFAVIAPKAVLLVIAIFAVVLLLFRYVSLASMISSALFPFAVYTLYRSLRSPYISAAISGACALIIIKHHQNIGRLIAGNESRFGTKKS
jgi:acyl phosphate:glycerol-3-phosphate acyltransferase